MPELPEVETVRRTLAPIVGRRVTKVWTSRLALRGGKPVSKRKVGAASMGARISDVRRWGKYLLVDFEQTQRSLLVHLGMTGRLRVIRSDQEHAPHTHLVMSLSGGRGAPRDLRFSDPRRFGIVSVATQGREREHPALAKLGVDPITDTVDGELLYRLTRGSRRALKTFLLDQRAIAGVGNIYASEALWQARLPPGLRAHRLSRKRAEALAAAVGEVLRRALEHGGTSLRDFVNADGHEGEHSHYLWVYDREGEACKRSDCSGIIRRRVQQGRATFSCPRCQSK